MNNGEYREIRELLMKQHEDKTKQDAKRDIEFAKFTTQSNADHKHLAGTVEAHIEKDEIWKNSQEAQVDAIGNALLTDRAQVSLMQRLKQWRFGIITTAAVVLATLLDNFWDKLF